MAPCLISNRLVNGLSGSTVIEIILNFARNLRLIYGLNLLTVCFTAFTITSPFASRHPSSFLESLIFIEVLLSLVVLLYLGP